MGFDEGRNEFEEILGEKSSDENYIEGNVAMDMSVVFEGYMVIAISKSLGYSREAISEGMNVNANSRIEQGRTPKFLGGAKVMRVSRREI